MSQGKVLGLMPARGGSKGIPGKNVAELCGRPLLGWAAEEAGKAGLLDRLVISSDDPEIIAAATAWGLEAPFVRPAELASDTALVVDAIAHALNWFREHEGVEYEHVCLLQPTNPLVLAEDYDRSVDMARRTGADTVITVARCGQQHPAVMFELDQDGRAEFFARRLGWDRMPRRQDLPPLHVRTGLAYVFRSAPLLASRHLYSGSVYAVEVDADRALDINEPLDLEIARVLLPRFKQQARGC